MYYKPFNFHKHKRRNKTKLKKQLKGYHFSSDTEVIAATETWLDGQPSEFFFEWHAKVRAMG
jgi:hypothetical protein